MSLTIGSRGNIAFATVNIPCGSNEDRVSNLLSHTSKTRLSAQQQKVERSSEEMVSFGVFDGHGGSATAELLSDSLHVCVVRSYAELCRIDASTRSNTEQALDANQHNNSSSNSSDSGTRGMGAFANKYYAAGAALRSSLTEEQRRDSFLALAVNEALDSINHIAQSEDTAGSTVCSLFLRPTQLGDGSMRAVCANVGDSRCIMIGASPSAPPR